MQLRHDMHEPLNHPRPTRWPTLSPLACGPRAATVPTTSWPGTRGYWLMPQSLSSIDRSLWQIPHEATSISTCSSPRGPRSIPILASLPLGSVAASAMVDTRKAPGREGRFMKIAGCGSSAPPGRSGMPFPLAAKQDPLACKSRRRRSSPCFAIDLRLDESHDTRRRPEDAGFHL